MPTLAELKRHLAYSEWASRRLLQAAGGLTHAELTRDFGFADKGALATLVHIMAADRIWLRRVQGAETVPWIDDSDFSLDALQTRWPAVWSGWQMALDRETVPDGGRVVEYKDTRGRAWSNVLSDIVLHVVNHGTHHRGQVAGFIRAMGHTPPATDLTAMLRGLA